MTRRTLTVFVFILCATLCQAAAIPVGTLSSTGSVRVSGVPVPSGTTIFSGDIIEAGPGQAVFTSRDGDAVLVGGNASVKVSGTQNSATVEILRGMSRVQVRSKDLKLIASNWTLATNPDPKTGRATADIVRGADGTVSLNVNEGAIVTRNAQGKTVTVAAAGRPALLPAAAAPALPPPSASPKPQGGSGGSSVSAATVGAWLVGAAAIAVGVAALTRDTTDDQARALAQQASTAAAAASTAAQQAAAAAAAAAAQATALAAANTALTNTVNSLRAQVTALQTLVNSLALTAAQQQALVAQLSSVISQLQAAQNTLISLQTQINGILAKVATGTATAEDLATLSSLQAQQASVSAQVGSLTATVGNLANQIGSVRFPSPTLP